MSENQDLSNWIYEDHKLSLETLIDDFSKIPDSNPVLTPILTRENQTCFGKFIEYKGVKTSYLGAFTKKEEEFLKSIYSQFNGSLEIKTMRFIHTVDKNGLINGADIHLFSGSSKLATFRIDINRKSNATHILSVQKILKFLIDRNIKFDLILLDPPYNSTYDKKYKTHYLNTIGGNTTLTSALKILVRHSTNKKGYIAMKSYFDPVLEKNSINRKTVSNLKLQDEYIILYDNYDKISSLHIYAN